MPVIMPGVLQEFVQLVLTRLGVSSEEACITADTMITADLRGVSTHGCEMLPEYVRRIRVDKITPRFAGTWREIRPWQAALDAQIGLGQVAATKAMEKALESAGKWGIGMVGVSNSNHFGAAAYYAMMALKQAAPHDQEVFLPGEKEHREWQLRSREGIPLHNATAQQLARLGDELQVQPPWEQEEVVPG